MLFTILLNLSLLLINHTPLVAWLLIESDTCFAVLTVAYKNHRFIHQHYIREMHKTKNLFSGQEVE